MYMEVTITQFRHDLFDLVTQAMNGNEVWVSYKGRRFRVVPEDSPKSRLERLTPLDVITPDSDDAEALLQKEMQLAWEQDWSQL